MVIALFAAAVVAGSAATPPAPPCKPLVTMTKGDGAARIRPLGAMPPATPMLALYREIGGCSAPVVARRNVGMPTR